MSYAIHDIDITQPLPTIALADHETGVALIVRYKKRPIGFVMQAMDAGGAIAPHQLSQWLGKELGKKIVQEQLHDELRHKSAASEKHLPEGQTTTVCTDMAMPCSDQQHQSNSLPPFPLLTVAICTKDRPDTLSRCLNSLIQIQVGSDHESSQHEPLFEILVVDNAPSDDRTMNVVASLPSVRYTREAKPGLDFARNHALHAATGELLAYLDDDVTVDRHWLDGLMEAWTENPDAGAFTGLILPFELETEAQVLFERRGGFQRGFEKIRYGNILPGNPLYPCGSGIFGAGCNMAFRRDVLLKLDGFDEALDTGAPLPGGGDLDIFYRVVRAGYPLIYEPRYLVFHQHRREMDKLRRQYWTWGLGFMAFVAKSWHADPPQRSQFRRLIHWWFTDQFRQIKQGVRRRHPLPLSMIWAELSGGIVGLLGEYDRSRQRIAHIRKHYSHPK